MVLELNSGSAYCETTVLTLLIFLDLSYCGLTEAKMIMSSVIPLTISQLLLIMKSMYISFVSVYANTNACGLKIKH